MADGRARTSGLYAIRLQRIVFGAAVLGGALSIGARMAFAQGITTAAIHGTVVSENGASMDGAGVRVTASATGFVANTLVRGGRFLVQGIEVGGPYVIEIRRIGFVPQRSGPVYLTLGEPLKVHFLMRALPVGLEAVVVAGSASDVSAAIAGGSTVIPEAMIKRLPTLNRNFYDFVALAPQVSTKVGSQRSGVSGAGANLRFNNFLINGADERNINGSVSAASNVGKSIPLDAVKEFQVLVAPYDVRYGDFAGALVNTVTQFGTNHLHGSAFGYWRNDGLARGGELASSLPYNRLQYGLSAGGPVVRDRAHFFIATEMQRLTSPAPGPYIGQSLTAVPPVPVRESDLDRMGMLLRGYGLAPGSSGAVENNTPLKNLFARVDLAIPRWNSRAMGFFRYGRLESDLFSRAARDTFYLSSYKYAAAGGGRLTSIQLHTDLPGTAGGHNELVASLAADRTHFVLDIAQPLVRVLAPGVSGGAVTIASGTPEVAQGGFSRARSFRIRDELSLPWGGTRMLLLGAQAEHFRVQRGGVRGGYGTWTFASLDDFAAGRAERFEIRKDRGSASAPLTGGQFALYAGNEWHPGDRISLTTGVRADVLHLDSRAPYNAVVDSIFARRTDEMPHPRAHISPRVGFTWDIFGDGRDKVRGGMGIFTGRPPLAWFVPALSSYGLGIETLRCGTSTTDAGPAPAFIPDYRAAPEQCASGSSKASRSGEVDLLDRNLRMAQSLRTSVTYERKLRGGLLATGEVLVSRGVSDFMFVNMNLRGPQAVDRYGRVLYGTIGANGIPDPALRAGRFSEVIDLRNTGRNYSRQFSARLERRFADGLGATLSYTHSRTRDVQSPSRVNIPGISIWADARATSGRHEDAARGISLNDLPHRATASLAYTAPWLHRSTTFAFYYVGESGSPFTYIATGVNRRGDLNADGSNANDPIYVPRDARDPAEILFVPFPVPVSGDAGAPATTVTVQQQAAALEQVIESTPCLRRQRGQILERNSCREPWSHTTIASVRHTIPVGIRAVEAQLEVFNVLNLLNNGWGRLRVAAPRILEHVGQTMGPAGTTQPIFRFDPTRSEWTTLQAESAFQFQLALRYRF
ncbi:MAG: TonB-dependent receptor [Gemmatimonadaceae bacterium]|nr:TonB-dependent receptor [Gemmatimonadaceae bacterium]